VAADLYRAFGAEFLTAEAVDAGAPIDSTTNTHYVSSENFVFCFTFLSFLLKSLLDYAQIFQ